MSKRNLIMRGITWSMYHHPNWYKGLSDRIFLTLKYRATFGRKLNLKNPERYTEKLQWIKLYERRAEYTTMVDKFLVKEYVSNKIGSEYIIPTIGVWDNFEDIDFNKLPNQFVMKCTHDSGGLVICKDKNNFDIVKARKKINDSLKRNYYLTAREWPYKNVKPRIIIEAYMEDTRYSELRDYKFFMFNGKFKALYIASERQNKNEETKFDFFDENFRKLDIFNGHPNSKIIPDKPKNFELMVSLAKKLSENIPHIRVDFYEVDGKVFFGELTFSHMSGFEPFEPDEWDKIFGSWLQLSNIKKSDS